MRNRSFLITLTPAALLAALLLGALGCKDTEALAQLKKAKDALEERDDELASAEKHRKEAEAEAAALKTQVESMKESLEKSSKKEAELLSKLRACRDANVPTPPSGAACADYFAFMKECIPMMPAIAQKPMEDSVEQMKKAMAMGGGIGASVMEEACRTAIDAMRKIPQCSSITVPKPCHCDPKDPLCSC